MDKISIKVSIAGRAYPVTISDEGERANVVKASKLVSDKVKELEEAYPVSDKQDLLSMCALQLASQNIKLERNNHAEENKLAGRLVEMESFIASYLKKQ